jgi:hypothetical protein
MCEVIATAEPAEHSRALKAVTDRFSASLQFTPQQVRGMVEKSTDDLTQVASILHVNLKQSPFARQLVTFNKPGSDNATGGFATGETTMDRTLAETMLDSPLSMLEDEESGEENSGQNTESILTAGIQDISNSLVDDFSLNDILRIILETMYRAVGFKRVMLCLRDPKSGMMIGRFGFGPDTNEVVKTFRFPLAYSPDVFHLSTAKGVDILISDIDDPKISDKIPKWYREKVPARTFALFPLMLKNAPVALIYCDKDQAGSIKILERELQLLKTLRNQAILAIKQAS